MSAVLLHDIGYAPDLVITGFHPLDGARFLRGIGGSDQLVNLPILRDARCPVVRPGGHLLNRMTGRTGALELELLCGPDQFEL
jgi:hypothetical protein